MKKSIFILLLFSFLFLAACTDSANNAGNIPSSGPVSEDGQRPSGQQIVLPTGAVGSEQSAIQSQPPVTDVPTDPAYEFDDGMGLPEIPQ